MLDACITVPHTLEPASRRPSGARSSTAGPLRPCRWTSGSRSSRCCDRGTSRIPWPCRTSWSRRPVVLQVPGRPQQGPCDHVDVHRVRDHLGVVTEGRHEYLGLAVRVGAGVPSSFRCPVVHSRALATMSMYIGFAIISVLWPSDVTKTLALPWVFVQMFG